MLGSVALATVVERPELVLRLLSVTEITGLGLCDTSG